MIDQPKSRHCPWGHPHKWQFSRVSRIGLTTQESPIINQPISALRAVLRTVALRNAPAGAESRHWKPALPARFINN